MQILDEKSAEGPLTEHILMTAYAVVRQTHLTDTSIENLEFIVLGCNV